MGWLSRVPANELVRWARSYAPEQAERLEVTRSSVAALQPMPAEVRKAYFIFATTWQDFRRLVGAEVELNAAVESSVFLVCQRLVALHSTFQALHGPQHIEQLAAHLQRHVVLRSDAWRSATRTRAWAYRAGTFSQGRLTKQEADEAFKVVDAALERAAVILSGKVEVEAVRRHDKLTP
jgi:hypothetical protein